MVASADPTRLDFLLTPAHHTRAFAADARFLPNGQAKPVVVFVHGFKGFKDWGHFNVLADFFARQGYVFVKLDLSHNGVVVGGTGDLEDLDAFGRNNFSIELDDIGCLLDALHQPNATPVPASEMDLSRLFLVGHSRGGGLAILKAAEDARVKAVAAWAPITNVNPGWPEEMMQHWQQTGVWHVENARTKQQLPLYYQIVEDYHANRLRLDIPHKVRRKLRQPLLVIHGDDDETLPVQKAQLFRELKPDTELRILPGAGHMFGGAHPWPDTALPPLAQTVADDTLAFFDRIV
ncbi:alpha/beta fold hydrolase [Hymenobacter busanensis]|uniref:Alpha/beta fold hydrolase n=1 Tax=Hymenobacter busanensis TaxID=2607656 RepID=A0A7L4ZV92_9BACT|nr:alpha/beta fold hydrolase [Hymenobacter busanensis]KAA9339130.1 alpha/beta fold hydrolase [Hymenobacter busanensis]QHJ07108.1 alpha/beta fold hydrolase [Hymenobacter busanensis]